MKALSARQKRILEFLRRFLADHSYPPTIRDIVGGCKISSTSVADYNLDILEKAGHIRRHHEISRGIELLGGSSPKDRDVLVPVIGQIAAGEPIPVPSSDSWSSIASAETMKIPQDLIQGKKDVYALKVKGLSMIDALIDDGDLVLLQNASTVENGEMAAVWLKAEKAVTLKKVYRESNRVRLQPANSRMRPIYTRPENVEVQGRVLAVIRQLA